jgi:Zn finger protein HypA/HybF involved in hydrogenase expression
MHEAGLARAIAETIRQQGLVGARIRILVTGGHDDPAAFDSSLLFHLELAAPELDLGRIAIVHEPSERWCPSCGLRSKAVGDADCPACGRATMADRTEERIEIEADEPADPEAREAARGTSDPPGGDPRPSDPPPEGPIL